MSGHFELIDAPGGGYRFRLLDKEGGLVAVSVTFPTKKAAAAGIYLVREIAGTGLIRDGSTSRRAQPAHWNKPSQAGAIHHGAKRLHALGDRTTHRMERSPLAGSNH